MIAEVFTFSKLPNNYKEILNKSLSDQQIVYVIKDPSGNPKSITTSITQAIQKVQNTGKS